MSANVTNGLFAVGLNFGSGAFNGADRWLHIGVRTTAADPFTVLSARQPITATPYAFTAREVTGNVAASQLAGFIQPANIGADTITSTMLASGSIHSNHLAAGSVHSNALVIGSIHSNHLAVGSIHSNHLAAGSVHSNALALGSVTANALAAGSIHSNHLAAGSVHSNALVMGSIHSNHLAVGVIHSNHLAAGSVHSNALVIGSIHSNHLAVGSIHSNALAAGAVSVEKLFTTLNGSFSTAVTDPTPGFFEYFGVAVAAIGPDKLLVGAYQDSTSADNAGAAYLFSTNGTLVTAFTNPTPASSDFFGYAVAGVGTDKVLIGAYADNWVAMPEARRICLQPTAPS